MRITQERVLPRLRDRTLEENVRIETGEEPLKGIVYGNVLGSIQDQVRGHGAGREGGALRRGLDHFGVFRTGALDVLQMDRRCTVQRGARSGEEPLRVEGLRLARSVLAAHD